MHLVFCPQISRFQVCGAVLDVTTEGEKTALKSAWSIFVIKIN